MSDEPVLSMQLMALEQGQFGDLYRSPHDKSFGPKSAGGGAAVAASGVEVRLGNRPVARNLGRLYELGHKQMPNGLAVFDAYELWLITHAVSAIRKGGSATVRALGYEAVFDEREVCTIDLLPPTRFRTWLQASAELDLGAEGNLELPDQALTLLPLETLLGGGARLRLSSAVNVIGRFSCNLLSPVVTAVGCQQSRCEWWFEPDGDKPLLGDQLMVQTVLVHPGTDVLRFKTRGHALIKPAFYTLFVSTPLKTKWLDVECNLE